jgi:hypothetical protein
VVDLISNVLNISACQTPESKEILSIASQRQVFPSKHSARTWAASLPPRQQLNARDIGAQVLPLSNSAP